MFQRELRQLSFVPRWVITRNLRTQFVAEHSFYVAVYAGQIARFIGYDGDIGELYHAALWHDAEEVFTGDIPGPAKRNLQDGTEHTPCSWVLSELERRFPGEVRPISELQRKILKVANLLDEVFYQATEVQMGNNTARNPYRLSCDRLTIAMRELPNWERILDPILVAIDKHAHANDSLPENDSDLAPRS